MSEVKIVYKGHEKQIVHNTSVGKIECVDGHADVTAAQAEFLCEKFPALFGPAPTLSATLPKKKPVKDKAAEAPVVPAEPVKPKPPTLEEVLAAGYDPRAAHAIVAAETARFEGKTSDEIAKAGDDAAAAYSAAHPEPKLDS